MSLMSRESPAVRVDEVELRGRDEAQFIPTIDLVIDPEDVLQFLGYPTGRPPGGRITAQFEQAVAEARSLARACGVYRTLPNDDAPRIGLPIENAERLVIGLVTAGPEIEQRVSELLGIGEVTRAVLLDAAGSAAAEEAANRLSARIVGETAKKPGNVSCRISPGYGQWLLAAQKQLFELLPHERAGVSLAPSLMMIPRKSISFAMWIGTPDRPSTGQAGCSICELEHCRYRHAPREKAGCRFEEN